MLELAPHSRQLVHIICLDDAPRTTEDTYRVLVDELPWPDAAAGLQFVLRYSVPIFVKPTAAQPSGPPA